MDVEGHALSWPHLIIGRHGVRPSRCFIPVSKEQDPTGKTPLNPALEAVMRHGMFQRSQMLPYQEFKKERI
jgi:hypothetical protein